MIFSTAPERDWAAAVAKLDKVQLRVNGKIQRFGRVPIPT